METSTLIANTKTSEEIAKAYSSAPWWYDLRGFLILTFSYRDTLWGQIQFFGKNMGANHLEAAIGSGTLLGIILRVKQIFRQKTGNIVGFDYADKMLDGARYRFRKTSNVKLLRADVAKLPFESDHFDTINIANAVHCFPDVKSGLKEIHRVLKADGKLAVNVLLYPKSKNPLNIISRKINHWGIKKGILYTPYHRDEIIDIAKCAGFEIESERVKGNTLNLILRKN